MDFTPNFQSGCHETPWVGTSFSKEYIGPSVALTAQARLTLPQDDSGLGWTDP